MSNPEDKIADLIAKGKSLEERKKQVKEPTVSLEPTLEERKKQFTEPRTTNHALTGSAPMALRGTGGGCGCRKMAPKKAPPPIPPIVPGGYAEKEK